MRLSYRCCGVAVGRCRQLLNEVAALGESDRTVTATDEGTDPVAPQPTPSVPTVVIPAGQAMDEVSSFQIGDVIIIAVRVQPTLAPEVEP